MFANIHWPAARNLILFIRFRGVKFCDFMSYWVKFRYFNVTNIVLWCVKFSDHLWISSNTSCRGSIHHPLFYSMMLDCPKLVHENPYGQNILLLLGLSLDILLSYIIN